MTNDITRRAMLGVFPAAAVVAALPVASQAAVAMPAALSSNNPALSAAYADFLKAHAEHVEAKNALEWLADEWKHRWPLAPVEILDLPHADRYRGDDSNPERDLIGRYIYRDNSEMRGRFSPEFISKTPKACWKVQTAKELAKVATFWEDTKVRGRSDASRAKSAAYNAKQAAKAREAIPLAVEYERQTAEVRKLSGVFMAQCRVADTRDQMQRAAKAVYSIPVKSAHDLQIKAEVLKLDLPEVFRLTEKGMFGPFIRIAQDAIELNEVTA